MRWLVIAMLLGCGGAPRPAMIAPAEERQVADVESCTSTRATCRERALVRACVAGSPAACRDLRLARSLFCGY